MTNTIPPNLQDYDGPCIGGPFDDGKQWILGSGGGRRADGEGNFPTRNGYWWQTFDARHRQFGFYWHRASLSLSQAKAAAVERILRSEFNRRAYADDERDRVFAEHEVVQP